MLVWGWTVTTIPKVYIFLFFFFLLLSQTHLSVYKHIHRDVFYIIMNLDIWMYPDTYERSWGGHGDRQNALREHKPVTLHIYVYATNCTQRPGWGARRRGTHFGAIQERVFQTEKKKKIHTKTTKRETKKKTTTKQTRILCKSTCTVSAPLSLRHPLASWKHNHGIPWQNYLITRSLSILISCENRKLTRKITTINC